MAVIFISHKLQEVFDITDRIVVLRDGENAGNLDAKTGTLERLIALMVGRDLGSFTRREARPATGPEVLRVARPARRLDGAIHGNQGNVGLSDGSVQECSNAGLQTVFEKFRRPRRTLGGFRLPE